MSTSVRELVASMLAARNGAAAERRLFSELDADAVARELRVGERAIEAGEAGLPSADADGPDLAELEVLGEIERRARSAAEAYRTQLQAYDAQIRGAVITADQRVRIEAAGQHTLADFKAAIVDDQNRLHLLRQEAEGREQEYRAFRERNRLTRMPRVVPPGREVLAGLVIAMFILAESILNGMFFAQGSEAGLIGGILQAFVLSLLNIGVAVLFAVYGLPLLLSRRGWVRLTGIVMSLAFVAWLLGLNLAIGHFRDLFVLNAGRVEMSELLVRLRSAPLVLADAQSGLLVLIGIGLAVIALIDVAAVRDPFPGFGRLGRERQRALERYTEERIRCLDTLTKLRTAASEDLTAAIDVIRNAENDLQHALDARARLYQEYVSFLRHLAAVHERLVRCYRDTNRRVRASTGPAYFLKPVPQPPFLVPAPLPPLPRLELELRGEVIARIEEYMNRVHRVFDEALSEYQPVGRTRAGED